MGWSVGFDQNWNRDIGYGVPSICDHPDCKKVINRGLGYVCCDQEPYGGQRGCGLFFCEEHSSVSHICERCEVGELPFEPTPDIEKWKHHKKTDPSWAKWREENPVEAEAL
jgi:hypothetical protein